MHFLIHLFLLCSLILSDDVHIWVSSIENDKIDIVSDVKKPDAKNMENFINDLAVFVWTWNVPILVGSGIFFLIYSKLTPFYFSLNALTFWHTPFFSIIDNWIFLGSLS